MAQLNYFAQYNDKGQPSVFFRGGGEAPEEMFRYDERKWVPREFLYLIAGDPDEIDHRVGPVLAEDAEQRIAAWLEQHPAS